MKIAQFPAIHPAVVAGHRTGSSAAKESRGNPVDNGSSSQATLVDRSQQVEGITSSRYAVPARLLTQRAIDTYSIKATYSLFGGEG